MRNRAQTLGLDSAILKFNRVTVAEGGREPLYQLACLAWVTGLRLSSLVLPWWRMADHAMTRQGGTWPGDQSGDRKRMGGQSRTKATGWAAGSLGRFCDRPAAPISAKPSFHGQSGVGRSGVLGMATGLSVLLLAGPAFGQNSYPYTYTPQPYPQAGQYPSAGTAAAARGSWQVQTQTAPRPPHGQGSVAGPMAQGAGGHVPLDPRQRVTRVPLPSTYQTIPAAPSPPQQQPTAAASRSRWSGLARRGPQQRPVVVYQGTNRNRPSGRGPGLLDYEMSPAERQAAPAGLPALPPMPDLSAPTQTPTPSAQPQRGPDGRTRMALPAPSASPPVPGLPPAGDLTASLPASTAPRPNGGNYGVLEDGDRVAVAPQVKRDGQSPAPSDDDPRRVTVEEPRRRIESAGAGASEGDLAYPPMAPAKGDGEMGADGKPVTDLLAAARAANRTRPADSASRVPPLQVQQEEKAASGDLPDTKPSDGLRLDLAGQLNMGVLFGRAGNQREMMVVDNSNSPSSVKGVLSQALPGGYMVGAQVEATFQFNATHKVTLEDTDPYLSAELHRGEIFLHDRQRGTLWFGRGSTASDGITTQDLSGTSLVTNADMTRIGANYHYDESITGSNANNTVRLSDVYNAYNGLGRADRLRYDSPAWRGLVGSGSVTLDGRTDFAMRWQGQIGEAKVASAFGLANGIESPRLDDTTRNTRTHWGLSSSVLFPFGGSATVAYGTDDPLQLFDASFDGDEFFYYAKLGQRFQLLDVGLTALSVDYGFTQNYRIVDEDVEKYGFALVQRVEPAALDLYFSVHTTDLDETSSDSAVDETQTYITGARLTF